MRILYTLIISTVLIGCEPQITDKSAGKWYGENPPQLSGQKFNIGSDQAAEMVVKVILDFADMDKNEIIIESMADSVNFYSPEGYQKLDMTTTETLASFQEPYDSIKRSVVSAVPLTFGESSINMVDVVFRERRFKDGEVNRRRVFERFWVNSNGKISTISIFPSDVVPNN
jgi:hypothetical protein